MGKSTLDTRRGCDSTLSRPENATLGKNIFWVRQRCESAHPIGAQKVSGQKHFGRESLRLSARPGRPVLPVFAGHFSRVQKGQRA